MNYFYGGDNINDGNDNGRQCYHHDYDDEAHSDDDKVSIIKRRMITVVRMIVIMIMIITITKHIWE